MVLLLMFGHGGELCVVFYWVLACHYMGTSGYSLAKRIFFSQYFFDSLVSYSVGNGYFELFM